MEFIHTVECKHDGVYTRYSVHRVGCILHKVKHTHGGLGHTHGGTYTRQSIDTVGHTYGGTYIRQSVHPVGH